MRYSKPELKLEIFDCEDLICASSLLFDMGGDGLYSLDEEGQNELTDYFKVDKD